jgi:serine protease AprX
MKRASAVLVLLVLLGCQDQVPPTTTQPSDALPSPSTAALDPSLQAALATASATDELEVIVTYDASATTRDAVTDAVLDAGAGVIHFRHLPMVAGLATSSQITAIQAVPEVTGVWLNRELGYHNAGVRPSIRADVAHSLGYTGKGVGIAILDSGVDGLHPDLAPAMADNVKIAVGGSDNAADAGSIRDFLRQQFITKEMRKTYQQTTGQVLEIVQATTLLAPAPNTDGSSGHGTHVAGITAGRGTASAGTYKGVAPGAHLVGIGAGDALFIFWALTGFDYILEKKKNGNQHNIQVVNNSWGSNGEFDAGSPINVATRAVRDAGVAVVFSAGNCGEGDDPSIPLVSCPPPGETQLNPYSVAPWAISVAAGCKLVNPPRRLDGTTRCEDPQGRAPVLADFSSRGLPGRGELFEPDITAPGVFVISTRASTGATINALQADEDLTICNAGLTNLASYVCASGTSMSSPVIAGVVALMEQASGGKLTPASTVTVLKQTARKFAGYQAFEMGAGYVDAAAAVQGAAQLN